jgi:hypothetical protein
VNKNRSINSLLSYFDDKTFLIWGVGGKGKGLGGAGGGGDMGGGMDWDFGGRGRDVVGPKNFSP